MSDQLWVWRETTFCTYSSIAICFLLEKKPWKWTVSSHVTETAGLQWLRGVPSMAMQDDLWQVKRNRELKRSISAQQVLNFGCWFFRCSVWTARETSHCGVAMGLLWGQNQGQHLGKLQQRVCRGHTSAGSTGSHVGRASRGDGTPGKTQWNGKMNYSAAE